MFRCFFFKGKHAHFKNEARQGIITTAVGSMLAVGWMYTLPKEVRHGMNKVISSWGQMDKWLHDIYHLFWDLLPYLRPVFPDGLCDTGWGTTDWRILPTWEGVKRKKKDSFWVRPWVFCIQAHLPVMVPLTCSTVHSWFSLVLKCHHG